MREWHAKSLAQKPIVHTQLFSVFSARNSACTPNKSINFSYFFSLFRQKKKANQDKIGLFPHPKSILFLLNFLQSLHTIQCILYSMYFIPLIFFSLFPKILAIFSGIICWPRFLFKLLYLFCLLIWKKKKTDATVHTEPQSRLIVLKRTVFLFW